MEASGKEQSEKMNSQPHHQSMSEGSRLFREVLEAHRGETHVVVLQNYPDPDAIASGFTHKLISENYNIQVDILYGGKISHQENIAMVRLLDIELIPYDETLDLNKYQGAIFIDNQGTSAEEILVDLEAAGIPPLIVVDHHETQDRLEPEFSDIRRSVGATSTIYTEYLEAGLIEMDKSRKEHVMAATALFHGIHTDTGGFIRASTEDFNALRFLSHYRDAELLELIMSQSRSKHTMDVIRRALAEHVVAENYSIAGIGYLRSEDRDAIPQAADFLLTEENVHTAIVYGIIIGDEKDERVVGSMRTSKITVDPDQFIKEVLGKGASGMHFGGGRQSAGGFEIPVGFLAGGQMEEYQDIKWKVFDNQIKLKIFEKIGVD